MKLTHSLLLAASLLLGTAAHAQVGVGASFTAQTVGVDTSSLACTFATCVVNITHATDSLYGTTLSFQADFGHLLRTGVGARATVTRGSNDRINTYGFGPRLVLVPPRLPVRPYAEAEVDFAQTAFRGAAKLTGRAPGFTAILGVDVGITPHVDWRAIEYSHSSEFAENGRNQFSSGVIVRFSGLPSFLR